MIDVDRLGAWRDAEGLGPPGAPVEARMIAGGSQNEIFEIRRGDVHGALGVSNEMPFFGMVLAAGVLGLADGPTEVHKVTVARQVLRNYRASDDIWPTQHLPKLKAAAREKYAEYLEHEVGNL